MKTIISALHFPWQSMEQCLEHVRNTLHLDGVELSFRDSYQRPHCTREDIASVRRINESFGLSLYAHIWEDLAVLGPHKAVETLLGWKDVALQAGVLGFVIHGGSYPDRNEGIARTRETFERVLPELEKTNLVLYLENHYAYDYKHCQELFSEVWEFQEVLTLDSPSLRFCFDTGHGHLTWNTEDLLTQLAPYLVHVHLADNQGLNDDHCMYKQGTVAWDVVYRVLKQTRFDGTFCVEFPVRDETGPFDQCMADIENLAL